MAGDEPEAPKIRLEVLTYDSETEVAVVRGMIFGTMEEYKAPRIELAPIARKLEIVEEDEGWADESFEEEPFDSPKAPRWLTPTGGRAGSCTKRRGFARKPPAITSDFADPGAST